MPTNDIDHQDIVDNTTKRHRLGTDAENRTHYFSHDLGAVWALDESGDIVHVEVTHRIGDWVDHVADDCGWAELHYTDQTLGEQLGDLLGGCA
jgi:hypothetical protein